MVTLTILLQTTRKVLLNMTISTSQWFLTLPDVQEVSYFISCELSLHLGSLVSNDTRYEQP